MTRRNSVLQKLALKLRHSQTDAEKIVWSGLRNNQLGFKFQRQKPVDHYIVDFICIERRLIVEIDGGQHNEKIDEKRTRYLQDQGFTILRFWNNDILANKEGVLQTIQMVLKSPSPVPLRRPTSPAKGGEVTP